MSRTKILIIASFLSVIASTPIEQDAPYVTNYVQKVATLASPLATKPPCEIVKNENGEFIVVTNNKATGYWDSEATTAISRGKVLGEAFRNRWAFVDISILIGQAIEKNISELSLIPLIKSHIKTRDGLAEVLLEGFAIDGIAPIRDQDQNAITGFTLPVYRQNRPRYILTYRLTRGPGFETMVPLRSGVAVYVFAEPVPETLASQISGEAIDKYTRGTTYETRNLLLDKFIKSYLEANGLEQSAAIVDLGVGYPPLTTVRTAQFLKKSRVIGVDINIPAYVVEFAKNGAETHIAFFDDNGAITFIAKHWGDPRSYRDVRSADMAGAKEEAVKIRDELLVKSKRQDYADGTKKITFEPINKYAAGQQNLEFVKGGFDLPIAGNADVVRAVNVFWYYSPEEAQAAIWKIGHKVNDGGIVIIGSRDLFLLYQKERNDNKGLPGQILMTEVVFHLDCAQLQRDHGDELFKKAVNSYIHISRGDLKHTFPQYDEMMSLLESAVYDSLRRHASWRELSENASRLRVDIDTLVARGITEYLQRHGLEASRDEIGYLHLKAPASAEILTGPLGIDTSPQPDLNNEKAQATIFKDIIGLIETNNEGKPTILALGTSWIKGYAASEQLQHGMLNPLIVSIRNYCKKHGIVFIDKEDADLATAIAAEKARNKNAKVVVLAGATTVKSEEFGDLRKDENALLVGVDNSNLTTDNYVRLIEMLNMSLRLAFNLAGDFNNPNIAVKKDDAFANIYILIPKAEPVNYEILREIYKVLAFA